METSNAKNAGLLKSFFLTLFWAFTAILFVSPVTNRTRAQELVSYPSAEVAFICGPQLRANSPANPFPWFDSTAASKGSSIGAELPAIGPRVLTGTISVSTNSLVVSGNGTRFRSEVDPQGPSPYYDGWLRIFDGTVYREVKVSSVQSDTQLTLTTAWGFGSVSGATADTYHYDSAQGAWNYDWYYRSMYYDTALVEYINYYRTGDPVFLGYARKIADSWWGSQYINFGTVTQGPNNLPPRSQAFAGLMLRALDGKPEYWDYLYRQVRSTFDLWVKQRRDNPTLYYDIREDGYAQLYAVMLARVLPDQYPLYGNGTLMASTGTATDGAQKRAALLADSEDIAVNFFGRLQKPDGSWRWDVDDGPDPTSQNRNVEQPFMVGLYLESVALLHQLTANANVKTNLVNQLTSAVRHLYNDAYEKNDPVTNFPPYKWRSFFYYWGGGTVAEPNKYSPPSPKTVACGLANCGDDSVAVARHLNSTIQHAFGYAYAITGDTQYRTMGDEVFGASFGDATDSIRSLAGAAGAKEYDMNYRASGRYLAWRLSSSEFSAKINFQPAASAVPSGYMADSGLIYGDRGNGYTYGWDATTNNTVERNSANSPDKRYDTLNHLWNTANATWEIAVPNGTYTVHVVSGDALWYDSVYEINVEGVLTVNGTPTSATRWIEGTQTVTVNDGKLTVNGASGSYNNKICFIDISSMGRVNVALASNGGVASASSTLTSAGLSPAGTNNGDRKGANWNSGGGWADSTSGTFPDWLQIDFNGSQTIDEVDVFTIQDNYTNPVEPTEAMTFSTYGLTAYDVQYWDGSTWVTVSGGSITGNNKVGRKINFSAISTSKIRVVTNAAIDTGYSRITEVEAWGNAGPPPVNVALAANGGVASASSTLTSAGLSPAGTNNGDRKGANWNSGGGWADSTSGTFPDWLQIDFNGSKTISEIDVFTIQDNYTNPTEPSEAMTFSTYGLTAYDVQYWDGSSWVTVSGGGITSNNKVWRKINFSAVMTSKIRVVTNAAIDNGYSRITEVEAYSPFP